MKLTHHYRFLTIASVFLCLLLPGCTLKLSTDLSKLIGINNPQQLIGSEEVKQIATKIGEGIGAKMLEGELLAEDMGKGLGNVFLEPQKGIIIEDPISVDVIEKSGTAHITQGNYREAINCFKRTNNLYTLESLALMLFDQGMTKDAADLHQYLIERRWPIRPPYLVAKNVEREGLGTIHTQSFKEIDPQVYNQNYYRRNYTVFDAIPHLKTYSEHHTTTIQEMRTQLKKAPVIILADAYFVVNHHAQFTEILASLERERLTIGLERRLQELKDSKSADDLGYSSLFAFIDKNNIPTFTHGPEAGGNTTGAASTTDFFGWDSSLSEKTKALLNRGKQVIIIIGETHASADHLPFLIEEVAQVNPALVIQNPLNLSVEQILEKNYDLPEQLTAWGLSKDRVLTIDNDFYLNTDIPADDLLHYLRMFNLEDSLKVYKKNHPPHSSPKEHTLQGLPPDSPLTPH